MTNIIKKHPVLFSIATVAVFTAGFVVTEKAHAVQSSTFTPSKKDIAHWQAKKHRPMLSAFPQISTQQQAAFIAKQKAQLADIHSSFMQAWGDNSSGELSIASGSGSGAQYFTQPTPLMQDSSN